MNTGNDTGAPPGSTTRHFHPRQDLRLRLRLVYLILLAGLNLFALAPLLRVARAQGSPREATITMQISQESASLTAGEWVEFSTGLRNDGATATPPLAAHLSIAAVDEGRHVDPEDWSPQRTQYLPPLQPGESVQLTWKLHALFEGVFVSFVTVASTEESFPPAMSPFLRLQVAPDQILPLKDVIPVVAMVPLFPLALLVFTVAYRRWH